MTGIGAADGVENASGERSGGAEVSASHASACTDPNPHEMQFTSTASATTQPHGGPSATPVAATDDPSWQPRLDQLAEQAVVVTDLDGTIRAWNPFAERLYGWPAEEVVGRNILDVTPAGQTREQGAEIMERLRRGESWSGEFTVRRRDGTTFVAHVTDTPVMDDGGKLTGIVGVSYDLGARRAAETDLRKHAADFEDFFENASMGLHWVAGDGTILRANRTELQMLGYEPDEYVGHNIAEFHADPEAIRDILERLGRGETLLDYEAQMRCKDGSLRHVLINSNVRFREGRFVHTRCLTRDVTERYRAEREMRRLKDEAEAASQAKSEFLAVVSHELRTPLNAVIGYGELLSDEIVGKLNETQRRHLARITASAGYLLELIDQILSLSKVEADREEVAADRVELKAFADQAAALFVPLATRKGLALKVEVDPAAGVIETDRAKLRQILLNLLSNAVKFTERGSVTLRVWRDAGSAAVYLSVADTGPGIAPEHWDTIFDPFTQVDQSRTRREGGTGLGLTVSRRFSALLGGEVTVESAPGEGATFTVRLPTPR
jgi:PAS domain S-box-containing protein